jgi:hypothetical protein
MNGNKYETAVAETRSVLGEWLTLLTEGQRIDSPHSRDIVARQIVDRLVAKGVIQDTDPEELRYRTGPLEPGRKITGGERTRAERFQEAKEWVLTEHGETLRRLGEGPEGDD